MSHFPSGNPDSETVEYKFGRIKQTKKTIERNKERNKKKKGLGITPPDARCSASKTFGDFLEHIKMHKHTPNEATKKVERKTQPQGVGWELPLHRVHAESISSVNARKQMQRSL